MPKSFIDTKYDINKLAKINIILKNYPIDESYIAPAIPNVSI